MKSSLYHFYMGAAKLAAKMSYAERLQVGAVIVTASGAMYPGYNGTLKGFPNVCELPDGSTDNAITVHAEKNALYKMLEEGVTARGATMFVTHSCCEGCAQMTASVGIERVVYLNDYKDMTPMTTLKKAGVIVEKYDGAI
jgi:dCMP deaminase